MRRQYHPQSHQDTDSIFSSRYSDGSDHSQSTAPTSQCYSSRPSSRYDEKTGANQPPCTPDGFMDAGLDLRASVETYASTVPSEDEVEDDEDPVYAVPELPREELTSEPLACTPPEFAQLFQSTRRLHIAHDDTTEDGNMNVRVDTKVSTLDGGRRDFTLFHLRLYDLKSREFSLRRYCRDSGREICHTSRKPCKPVDERRPALQRSVSNVLASFRGKHESKGLTSNPLRRQDSGYQSHEEEPSSDPKGSRGQRDHVSLPTNTVKLEFSNYAQVNLKRRGTKSSKRYECEYWGARYTWKRSIRQVGSSREISYHLVNDMGLVLAHIVPVPLTPAQKRKESEKGGWVPPCSMWINDERVLRGLTDVADMIVATGLVALVDDSIKQHFHSKRSVHIILPLPSQPSLRVDHLTPKRLIDDVFNRRNPSHTRQQTPLRQIGNRP